MTSWVHHKGGKKPVQAQWDEVVAHPRSGLLEYVYAWERRCRGYDLFPQPVCVEPQYIPFDPSEAQLLFQNDRHVPEISNEAMSFQHLALPSAQKVTAPVCAAWLGALPLRQSACFEVVADSRDIVFQLGSSAGEAPEARAALAAYFPLAVDGDDGTNPENPVSEDALRPMLDSLRGEPVGYQVVDFGLQQFAYRPLRRFPVFAPDPLAPLLASVASLEAGEVAGLQILFTRAVRPWPSSLAKLVALFHDDEQDAAVTGIRTKHENEETRRLKIKLASPLLAATIRVFAVSRSGDARAFELCRRIGSALNGFADPEGNALIALDNRQTIEESFRETLEYPDEQHFRDLVARRNRRSGFLISADELVALVHPPSETLIHPKLNRPDGAERVLPQHLLDAQGPFLGGYPHRGRVQPVVWPDEFRNRHAYLLGATRMGKSTLLLNLIAQDMAAGRGLCLIDPHGDLALDALKLVPESRAGDTVYLDFGDREHPPAIGLLEANDDWECRLVTSDLLSVLRRLFASSWGDRLEHILRHVLLTLLSEPGHTLRDIRPLLADKDYRARVLAAVTDPELKSFWNGEFGGYSASSFAPLYNKLGLLLSSPMVRNVVAQPQSKLPLAYMMREKRVLIVNLNCAQVGEDNAHFLGAMLVSKIQIAAMQSLRSERGRRVPFTLYVDEFQNFVVSSFEKILSEAGKAGLSLVMANQFLEQLQPSLQSAILGNVGTLVSFRVSAASGRLLEKELAGRYKETEIVSLGRGEAVIRLGQALDSVKIHTLPPPERNKLTGLLDDFGHSEIIARSREDCCRERQEVEAEIATEREAQAASSETNGDTKAAPTDKRKGKTRAKKSADSVGNDSVDAAEPNSTEADSVNQPEAGAEAGVPMNEPTFFGLPDETGGGEP